MFKKFLIISSILFFTSVILMPLSMPYCGTNGFHMGFQSANTFCGHSVDLAHISFMRSLIFVGLVATFYIFAKVFFNRRVLSLISNNKKTAFNNFTFLLKQLILGRMKPFDKLLLAYSSGIVQPKTF